MTWRLYALLSGGAFVATYLVSGQPGTLMPAPASQPRTTAASSAPSAAENEIQELAARLGARVREAVSYQTPTRNPFEFGRVRQPEPARVTAPKPEAPVVVGPLPPPFTLSGVAADRVNGSLQRTAIFSGPTGVTLAREGETVGGYKVVTIGENDTVVESTADGSTHRLALK